MTEAGGYRRLSVADRLAGYPLGSVPIPAGADRGSKATGATDAWAALVDAVGRAWVSGPLVVAFSGGRDSSLLLAAAAEAARRRGGADPVAVTMRFDDAGSDEREWQDRVIQFLGLREWEIVRPGDELDLLGPLVTRSLARVGLRFAPNGHGLIPVFRAAPGATVLHGSGGDELLGAWRWQRRSGFLSGTGPRNRGTLATTLLGSVPSTLRRRIYRERWLRVLATGRRYPWLTPAGRALILPGLVEDDDQPVGWSGFLHWARRRRAVALSVERVAETAADAGARAVAPLLDGEFVAALAAAGARWGFASRTAVLEAVAGGHLPSEVIARRTKASFLQPFWGPAARAWVAGWDGTGVDPELVDVERVRADWAGPAPSFTSMLRLHQAWLAANQPAGALR
jgi:asparagine synthase (glutamine-hydrolysing)